MNTNNLRLLAALAVAALMGISNAGAQGGGFGGGGGGGRGGGGGFGAGGGGFDMASILQLAVDNLREPFEVKDDGEWKVIGDQIHKVLEARLQAETSGGGLMGLTRAFGRRPQGGGGAGNQDNNNQGGGRRRNFNAATAFGGTQDPTMEALQKAIDDNASTADLKAAVAKYVEARKMRQAKLEAAQTDLRKLLSVRQEAIAYSFGLL